MVCFDFRIDKINSANVQFEFLTFGANYTDNEYIRAI